MKKDITRNTKCLLQFNLQKDKTSPYDKLIINIVNKVLRAKAPNLGNCDWGRLEFLCYGYQYFDLKKKLIEAGHASFATFGIFVVILDKWPSYPINCTGDVELTGIDSEVSIPLQILEARNELKRLYAGLLRIQKNMINLIGSNPEAKDDGPTAA